MPNLVRLGMVTELVKMSLLDGVKPPLCPTLTADYSFSLMMRLLADSRQFDRSRFVHAEKRLDLC